MSKKTGEHSNILLVNLSDPADRTWQVWFRAAFADGADWQQSEVTSVTALGTLPPSGKLILIYDPLHTALAVAAAAGEPPSAALAAWERDATALLAFHRANRRSVFLIASDAISGGAETLRDRLAGWAALAPSPLDPNAAPAPTTPPLLRLIAAQALHASPHLRRMAEELSAGGFAPRQGASGDTAVLDDAFADYQRGLDARPAATRAEQQNAQLFQQLLAMQATLEHEANAGAALQAEIESFGTAERPELLRQIAELSSANERLAAGSEALRAAEAQQGLLIEQVHAIQVALKEEADARASEQAAALLDRQQAQAAHEQDVAAHAEEKRILSENLQRAEEALQQVFLSNSWKVTAPLRATRRKLPWSRD